MKGKLFLNEIQKSNICFLRALQNFTFNPITVSTISGFIIGILRFRTINHWHL